MPNSNELATFVINNIHEELETGDFFSSYDRPLGKHAAEFIQYCQDNSQNIVQNIFSSEAKLEKIIKSLNNTSYISGSTDLKEELFKKIDLLQDDLEWDRDTIKAIFKTENDIKADEKVEEIRRSTSRRIDLFDSYLKKVLLKAQESVLLSNGQNNQENNDSFPPGLKFSHVLDVLDRQFFYNHTLRQRSEEFQSGLNQNLLRQRFFVSPRESNEEAPPKKTTRATEWPKEAVFLHSLDNDLGSETRLPEFSQLNKELLQSDEESLQSDEIAPIEERMSDECEQKLEWYEKSIKEKVKPYVLKIAGPHCDTLQDKTYREWDIIKQENGSFVIQYYDWLDYSTNAWGSQQDREDQAPFLGLCSHLLVNSAGIMRAVEGIFNKYQLISEFQKDPSLTVLERIQPDLKKHRTPELARYAFHFATLVGCLTFIGLFVPVVLAARSYIKRGSACWWKSDGSIFCSAMNKELKKSPNKGSNQSPPSITVTA